MSISWASRRRLAVLGILISAFLLIAGIFAYRFWPEPTCFDKRQNQKEEGIDCGGPCEPCIEKVHDIVILWTRFFPVKEGIIDVAALLDNENQNLGSAKFTYAFKVFDQNNVLIAIKEGQTFISPHERFLVFEFGIAVEKRIPARAVFEIRSVKWERKEPHVLKVDVLRTERLLTDISPRLEAVVKNNALQRYGALEASAIVLSSDGKAIGTSRALIDGLDIAEEKTIVFTWTNPLADAFSSEIYFRKIP